MLAEITENLLDANRDYGNLVGQQQRLLKTCWMLAEITENYLDANRDY